MVCRNIEGGVQMYGGCTEVWAAYRCMGMYRFGDHADTPKHIDSQTYPRLLTTPGYYISIKFKFVPIDLYNISEESKLDHQPTSCHVGLYALLCC